MPDGISLSTNGYKSKGKVNVDLSWSGTAPGMVDIYRNGSVIATAANTGTYLDETGQNKGTFSYQVCEAASTANCSNASAVDF